MVSPMQRQNPAAFSTYCFSDRIHCLIHDGIWCLIRIADNDGFLGGHCGRRNSQETKQE
jgi:hypothetical protein